MSANESAIAAVHVHAVTLLLGKESVGKSALAQSLSGHRATSANFRGTTVACEEYCDGERWFVDSPGLHRGSDADTVRRTLAALDTADEVLLVVQATHLDEDLEALLPLAQGKRAAVAVTFWDRVRDHQHAREAIARISAALDLPFGCIDARRPSAAELTALREAIDAPRVVSHVSPPVRAGWRIEPRPSAIEHPLVGSLLALTLLVLPAVLAVLGANAVAGWLEPIVESSLAPAAERFADLPFAIGEVLAGDYGLITMGPLLFVWAVPTVLVYALVIGAYKASGLVDRIGAALHPWLRPLGLNGRDVTRVLMGFGCNVPAVISTRSCSACSRPVAISAIAFGSACSYQLGATLAVFAAAGRSGLVVPYLLILVAATLAYTRVTASAEARSPLNVLLIERRTFLTWPSGRAIWHEASGTIREFFVKALPVFLVISVVASLVAALGALDAVAGVLGPVMALFDLPADAALPVVLASVRKDGILLLAEGETAAALTSVQLLAAVFLAGTLLPCLVTALTVGRELGWRQVGGMAGRQVVASLVVTASVAWGGALIADLLA